MSSDNAARIIEFLEQRIEGSENPRHIGKVLKGKLSDLWAYRVGDYRLLCEIHDATVIVLVAKIEHRGKVYRD